MTLKLATRKAATTLVNSRAVETKMSYLAGRWHHESKYEDINDYGPVLQKVLPKTSTFVRMNKRPFGVVVRLAEFDKPVLLYWRRKSNGECLALRTAKE